MPFLFIFGNTPKLSFAELESVFKSNNIASKLLFSCDLGCVYDAEIIDEEAFFRQLGGCVKMGKVIGNVESLSDFTLPNFKDLAGYVEKSFGLSTYGGPSTLFDIKEQSIVIKNELKTDREINIRFVIPTSETNLSPVVVQKQKLTEFVFLFDEANAQYYVAKTVCVSDFEGWNTRDYDRPKVSPHKGMLPPRVARMMLNLAQNKDFVVDPFCGTGTIINEALMLGLKVLGSDLDKKQVECAKENSKWLIERYKIQNSDYRIVFGDAKNLTKTLETQKCSAIVTEPDLGPNIGKVFPDVIRKLEVLFESCLRDWRNSLVSGGEIVIILPSFTSVRGEVDSSLVEHVIDKAKLMGYSLITNPIEYYREKAVVRRNIVHFKYN